MKTDDFFRASGRIPSWAAAVSIYATIISSVTYLSIPAKAFASDWTYYPMLFTIPLVIPLVVHRYLPYFHQSGCASAYELLEHRFSPLVRMTASALFCLYMVVRIALVLYLPALALSRVGGWDLHSSIIIVAIITIVYSTVGGLRAVVWGDVIQGGIFIVGALFSVIYLIENTQGSFSGFVDMSLTADKLRLVDWDMTATKATWWVILIGGLASNLISYTSDQTVIQRYISTRNVKASSHSLWINAWLYIISSILFYAIGTGLYTFYSTRHLPPLEIDAVFPYSIVHPLPTGISVLLMLALAAATMSTVSSCINSLATAFNVDFVKRLRPDISDNKLLYSARITSIAGGLFGLTVALMMSTWHITSLLDYFNTTLGLLTSGLGSLFFMAVFMPRINAREAMTGFIAGESVVFLVWIFTPLSFFLYGAIGLGVSIFIAHILNLIHSRLSNRQNSIKQAQL